jgi:hypothetical protein
MLTWAAEERQTDRYGFLYLYKAKGHQEEVLPLNPSPSGRSGRLIAHVLETRDSTHVGDVFLKIEPITPQVGERIVLGEGRLVVHEGLVGIKPADGREIFHCDPRTLYRAHSQTVELIFQEST